MFRGGGVAKENHRVARNLNRDVQAAAGVQLVNKSAKRSYRARP